MKNAPVLKELLAEYRRARFNLANYKLRKFPSRCVVVVESERYSGFGILAYGSNEPPPLDRLPVELESGNVWWYGLEECRRSVKPNLWPVWVRKKKDLR